MATSRAIHPDTVRASVTLSLTGPASYGGAAGSFQRGKARAIQDRSQIQRCLNVSCLRVIQYASDGSILSDTDAEAKPNKVQPKSIRKHSESPVTKEQSSAEKVASAEDAKARMAAAEQKWLEEEQRAAAGLAPKSVAVGPWDASMNRSQLAAVLAQATGQPVDGGHTKAMILGALEALAKG
jgi:hypothetical protein